MSRLLAVIGQFVIWLSFVVTGIPSGGLVAAELSIPTIVAAPGNHVDVSVEYRAQGEAVSALQFDLVCDWSVVTITAIAGSATTDAGKVLSTAVLPNGNLRFLLFGFNQNVLGDGSVANLTIQVSPNASMGSYPVRFSNASGADPTAQSVSISTRDGQIIIRLPRISLELALSAGGAADSFTIGSDRAIQIGYAGLTVNSGAAPYATAVFSLKKNGVTVTEAGVPASPPTTRARIFIDYRSAVVALPGQSNSDTVDINTGIAVVNPDTATANVTYTLRDTAGTILSIGNGTVAAGNHFAKFIDQLTDVAPNFNLPSNFRSTTQFGSLEIASDQPLSVLALRGTTNQRNDVLITTTPLADLTQSVSYDPVYFSQFADGGGYTTSLILLNTANRTERGTLQILDNNGSPLVVNQVGGTADSSFRYSITAGGAFHFQTDGFPAGINVGWVRLIPDLYSPTPIGSCVFSYDPGPMLISESGIPSAVSTTHARIYLDLSGSHNTGLAIANVGGVTASVSINAYQNDGVTLAGTSRGPLQLPAYGHDAEFADQFITGLPAGFTGVLDISSTTPFAALTMRSLVNERDDFLMTTFPIADANRAAPSPIVFPQVADGGGYVTQFIFISPTGPSTATLDFWDETGAPLAIGQ